MHFFLCSPHLERPGQETLNEGDLSWNIFPDVLGDLPNSPPDLCSTGKTSSPNRQHRQGTNSEICQGAQPTPRVLLTKMIKFRAETQSRMAISRAAASLSCAWWAGQGEQVQPEQIHPQNPAGAAGAGPRVSNIPAGAHRQSARTC